MAGTAAKSVMIICCQLHGMNPFSHCHKKSEMKPRRPNADAKNGVNVRHCEGADSELNLPKGSWIQGTPLNQMDEILSMDLKIKTKKKFPTPSPS